MKVDDDLMMMSATVLPPWKMINKDSGELLKKRMNLKLKILRDDLKYTWINKPKNKIQKVDVELISTTREETDNYCICKRITRMYRHFRLCII